MLRTSQPTGRGFGNKRRNVYKSFELSYVKMFISVYCAVAQPNDEWRQQRRLKIGLISHLKVNLVTFTA